MPGHVRHSWISVTAEAWPIVSETAFRLAITALAEEAPGILGGHAQALADELEQWLQPRAGALSLEILRQFRNGAWFAQRGPFSETAPVALCDYVRELSCRYLHWNGSHVSLRADARENGAERARRYRWLTLLLPPDLMAAAIAEDNGARLVDCEVRLVTPSLEQLLRLPVAATHYHVGAALRFHELWVGLMCRIATEACRPPSRATGRPPFGDWNLFQHRLLEAAVTRLLMAAYLREVAALGIRDTFDMRLPGLTMELLQSLAGPESRGRLAVELLGAVASLQRLAPARVTTTAWLRLAYRRLLGRAQRRARSVEELLRQDPLWNVVASDGAPPETLLVITALRHMQHRRSERLIDASLECAFWQYQRIRCLTFRYLTQEPGTSGLDWFQEHYDRISSLRGELDEMSFMSALRIDSRDACLGASEPRTTPGQAWHEVRDYVRSIARQSSDFDPGPGMRRPEVGLVFHFLKAMERGQGRDRRLAGDPRARIYPCRFGSWFSGGLRRARAIERALVFNPELLLILRGIDVASIEHAVPNWPVLPLLDRVRRASCRAAEQLAHRLPKWKVGPLRVTMHAGEDFRRLVEGLRRIHEPIEFGTMTAGDRFGHALALGTDPMLWSKASRIVLQPRQERLDDLLWELARYRKGHLPCNGGRIELVRAEAEEHARKIFDKTCYQLQELLLAREMRHCYYWLNRIDYPRFQIPGNFDRPELRCFIRYLRDPDVFDRGQDVVEVHCTESEIEMLGHAQRWLRRELASMEVTVESNPSSNLVIGDLADLEGHPAFRLMPVSPEDDEPTVSVSINVDNPITFCSCMADEFAHTYYALLQSGIPAADALRWLDRSRQAGWWSRFTLEASADVSVLQSIVNAWTGSTHTTEPA